jgi:hypothetical protein
MPLSRPEIIDFPFFTLEYRDGVFARLIPADAEDLGGGLFRQGGGKRGNCPPTPRKGAAEQTTRP